MSVRSDEIEEALDLDKKRRLALGDDDLLLVSLKSYFYKSTPF